MSYTPELLGQQTMAASEPVVIASDQSAVPVSGTFWQTTQPVSIAGTVAISAVSLPLPTGAATAAKQPALGTAGTASGDVLSIQGIAGMTAVKTDGSGVTQPVSNAGTFAVQDSQVLADNAGFTDGSSKVFVGGYILDEVAGTALTENDAAAARIDSKRAQVMVVEDATTRGQRQAVSAAGAASVNLAQLAGTTTDANSGNKSAGTLRVVLATDQPQLTNKLLVTPDANSAVNVAQVGGSNVSTVATGVQKVGIADSGGSAFLSATNALNSTGGGIQAAQLVGQFDDTSPTSITENQFGNLRMSANRNLYGSIRDAAGNERGANVNASNQLSVSVDNTPSIAGNVAHDAADSGNPVKVGGKARQTNPTAVADGDRVDCFRDDVGRGVVVLNQCRDLVAIQQTTITSSTSETTIVTAAGSGVFADLLQLTITNSSATALIVTLKDSTGGTTRGIYALAANGGITISFPTPLPQASANNNWTLTCGTSVASLYVVAQYAKNV